MRSTLGNWKQRQEATTRHTDVLMSIELVRNAAHDDERSRNKPSGGIEPRIGDLIQLSKEGRAIESFATVTRVLSSECAPGRFLVLTSEGKVRAVLRQGDPGRAGRAITPAWVVAPIKDN